MERKKLFNHIPAPKKSAFIRTGLAGLTIGGGILLSSQKNKEHPSNFPSEDAPIVMKISEDYFLNKLDFSYELLSFMQEENKGDDYLPVMLPIEPIQGPIPPTYGERMEEEIKVIQQKMDEEVQKQKELEAKQLQTQREVQIAAPATTENVDSAGGSIEPLPQSTSPTFANSSGYTVWDRLANDCESGGDWSINTGNGFYGGLQISEETWIGEGGLEYAQFPNQATRVQQIAIAEKILADQGWTVAWPGCSAKLGLG